MVLELRTELYFCNSMQGCGKKSCRYRGRWVASYLLRRLFFPRGRRKKQGGNTEGLSSVLAVAKIQAIAGTEDFLFLFPLLSRIKHIYICKERIHEWTRNPISTAIVYKVLGEAAHRQHLTRSCWPTLSHACKRMTGYDVYFQTGTDEHGREDGGAGRGSGNAFSSSTLTRLPVSVKTIWDLMEHHL